MLVNVPALIAIHRSYLAELRNGAGGTAAFAAQALAAGGAGEWLLDSMTGGTWPWRTGSAAGWLTPSARS